LAIIRLTGTLIWGCCHLIRIDTTLTMSSRCWTSSTWRFTIITWMPIKVFTIYTSCTMSCFLFTTSTWRFTISTAIFSPILSRSTFLAWRSTYLFAFILGGFLILFITKFTWPCTWISLAVAGTMVTSGSIYRYWIYVNIVLKG